MNANIYFKPVWAILMQWHTIEWVIIYQIVYDNSRRSKITPLTIDLYSTTMICMYADIMIKISILTYR